MKKPSRLKKFDGIHGLTSGSRNARTAWIQYTFEHSTATIRIYRYGWVVYNDHMIPFAKLAKAIQAAQKWAHDVGFWYIRERVTLELKHELKMQDGTNAP